MIEKLYINWEDINLEVEVEGQIIKKIQFISKDIFEKNYKKHDLNVVEKEIIEYFEGKRKEFNLELFIEGTEFQKKVWNELLKIPYGERKSYGEIAKNIGNPKAARAIGMACNKNKIPIIIPCHRVVGSNQKLVGFAGGLEVKSILLNLERENTEGDKNV